MYSFTLYEIVLAEDYKTREFDSYAVYTQWSRIMQEDQN
jgi:hypothetical protein